MRRIRFVCLSLITFLSATGLAKAADLNLDNIQIEDAAGVIVKIPHLQLSDCNLTQAEAETLFSSQATAQDRNKVLLKLRASKILAPSLNYSSPFGHAEVVDLEADNVANGEAARMTIKSGHVDQEFSKGGKIILDLQPLALEDVSFLRSFADADRFIAPQAAHIVSSGLTMRVWSPFEGASVERFGGPLTVGHVDIRNAYAGDVLINSKSTMSNWVMSPDKGSKAAQTLASFGYSTLSFDATHTISYDPDSHVYSLKDLTISGKDIGRFTLSGAFDGVDPKIKSSNLARPSDLLTEGRIRWIKLEVADAGLMGKIADFYAENEQVSPKSIREQWSTAAALMIPIMMHGDPAGLIVAQAVSSFVLSPGKFDVSLTAKDGDLSAATIFYLFTHGKASAKMRIEASATPK